ncbi:MAG: T9SS type A sorting domain-containing protein [Bacteroidia bacterium]|nr:T9SS type A sorting domain-containing protein [Bacteroidia bacterium]
MKIRIILIFAATMLTTFSIVAQTPTVLTRSATWVGTGPACSASSPLYATLQGIVNANGTTCSVSFEYGNTTSYGNTVTVGTVNGSTDLGVSAPVSISSIYGFSRREINYRLVVTNANGTFYGRNYIAAPFDVSRRIQILATCSDSPTMANYDLINCDPSLNVTLYYNAGGGFTGNTIIGSYQTQQIFVPKGSVTAFSYENCMFNQTLTNDQLCSETETPDKKIQIYTLGALSSNQSQLYKIENRNTYPVTVNVQIVADIYTHTIPALSAAFVVTGGKWDMQIDYNGVPFAIASASNFIYEEATWLEVTAISSTSTTATFELYNRDNAPHTYVMRNAAGNEFAYTVPANQSYNVTLPKEVWDVLISVYDINPVEYNSSGFGRLPFDETFGDPAYAINGKLKLATATPAAIVPLMPDITSLVASSPTAITANGTINCNPAQNETLDYYFIYGTDPNNLNQSTTSQQITIMSTQDATVSATVSGLTPESVYYFQLVAGTNQSAMKSILLSSLPTTHLKTCLRADMNVTTTGSSVSYWGDVSGNTNNASQSIINKQPILVENVINGHSVIRFDGTASTLNLPPSVVLGIFNNPYEMFIVAKSGSANIQFLISGANYEQFEYHLNGVGARFIPTTGIYLDKGISGDYTNGNAHIFGARASASGGAVRVDETDGITSGSNVLSSNAGNLFLGSRQGTSLFFNGDMAEVLIYNTVLTPQQRDSVELYLYNRYFTKLITTTVNPSNSGIVTGSGNHPTGTTATLVATPNVGYHFVNWTDNGNIISTNDTLEFTVVSDTAFVANFELNSYSVAANVNPISSGAISGAGTYNHGETVTLIATPNVGYQFVNWTENGNVISTNDTLDFTVVSDTAFVANFEIVTGILSHKECLKIDIFPNPFSNELVIVIEGNKEKLHFEISNAIGQVVFKGNLVEKTTVQTSNFEPGVYLIKLENGKIYEFKKIIK